MRLRVAVRRQSVDRQAIEVSRSGSRWRLATLAIWIAWSVREAP